MKIVIQSIQVLLLVAVMTIVASQKPRRDESYPPKEFLAGFKIIHEVCKEKTSATEEAIKEFSDGEIHEDENLKCYMNCIFHELNVVDDDGEMHYETLKRLLPDNMKDKVLPMFEGCVDPVGETQCDRAFWLHSCWKNADPVHYFLP